MEFEKVQKTQTDVADRGRQKDCRVQSKRRRVHMTRKRKKTCEHKLRIDTGARTGRVDRQLYNCPGKSNFQTTKKITPFYSLTITEYLNTFPLPVDVHADGLLRVLGLEEQQLRNNHAGQLVSHLRGKRKERKKEN